MHRKPLALTIVLLIAALAPATAIIGFCARMPCCDRAADSLPFSTERSDCCTAVACYEAPSAKLTSTASLGVASSPSRVSATPVVRPPMADRPAPIDPSPPGDRGDRLARLSVLLI